MPNTFIRAMIVALMINILLISLAYAQPPVLSYTTPNVYYVGNTIAPLMPTNTGGAVFNYGETITIAGSGFQGYNNGTGTSASFYHPLETALDKAGNIYVADAENHVVRKIASDGTVSTFAGNGSIGSIDGPAGVASFNHPAGLAFDSNGNLYVSDEDNNKIRKVTPAGVVSTFAGTGSAGADNGPGSTATLWYPCGIAVDASDNLYVAEYNNHIIRKITPAGIVSTFAGSTSPGFADGTGAAARFTNPISVVVGADGYVYVADRLNHRIRKISPAGVVTTLAGSGAMGAANGGPTVASFNYPTSITIDNRGYLFVADKNNNMIRRVSPTGQVSTTAGAITSGSADGLRPVARFSSPFGIVHDGVGYLYVADQANNKIRRVTSPVYVLTGGDLPPGLVFDEITGIISGTPTTVWPTTVYTVTGYNKDGSSSTPVSITVLDLSPAFIIGNYQGNLQACEGSVSTSTAQFQLKGVNLTGNIEVSTSAGFEIAGTDAGPFSNSMVLSPVNKTVDATIYVRLSATAPVGSVSGAVTLKSLGATTTGVGVAGTVDPLAPPTVSISSTVTTACKGTAVTFNATPVNGGTSPTYQWLINGVNAGTNSNTFTTSLLNNNDVISCQLTSSGTPCSSAATVTSNTIKMIVITPLVPVIDLPAPAAVCVGSALTFTAAVSNAGTAPVYQWQVNGINAGTNSPSFTSSTLNNGDAITLIVSSSNDCVSTATKTVNARISALPTVDPVADVTVCADALTSAINFSGTATSYTWTNTDPSIGLAASGSGNIAAFKAINTGNTAKTATITVTPFNAATGCTGPAVAFNIQADPLVQPSVTITADVSSACQGTAVTFTAVAANGGTAPVYQWQVNGVDAGTNSDTFVTTALNSADVVTCQLINNASCATVSTSTSNALSVSIIPLKIPVITLSAPTDVCEGSVVKITAAVTNAGSNPFYQWQVNGVAIRNNNTLTFSSMSIKADDVITFTVTSTENCFVNTTSDPVSVKINALPKVKIPDNIQVSYKGSVKIEPRVDGDIAGYSWEGAPSLSNTTIRNPVASPLVTTTYMLTVTTTSGCSVTVPVKVSVIEKYELPNTFTPNGDGINDLWDIAFLSGYPEGTLSIFSRSGEPVYRLTRGNSRPWDGIMMNGKPAPVGTYYYVIQLRKGAQPISGWLTLLR